MDNRRDIFKAYYITCGLLEEFEGFCSMIAEEDLLNMSLDFVSGKVTEKDFLEGIDFLFGLNKKQLRKLLKQYDKFNGRKI